MENGFSGELILIIDWFKFTSKSVFVALSVVVVGLTIPVDRPRSGDNATLLSRGAA